MLQVAPDYQKSGTAEEIKQYMGLDITGPGWYLTKTDTALVICNRADDETRWHAKQPKDTLYVAYIWNCPFEWTVWGKQGAPVRLDTRD